MRKITNAYHSIIKEEVSIIQKRWDPNLIKAISKKIPTIPEIRLQLLELSGFDNWHEFVENLRPGDCSEIAKTVSRLFPKVKMVSVDIQFSEDAINKMEPQDDPNMFICTHYLNKVNDEYLDFAKGSNRYENVYVLDGIDDMYSCIYRNDVKNYLKNERLENPKQLGVTLR